MAWADEAPPSPRIRRSREPGGLDPGVTTPALRSERKQFSPPYGQIHLDQGWIRGIRIRTRLLIWTSQPWKSNHHCFNSLYRTTIVLLRVLHYKTRSTILKMVFDFQGQVHPIFFDFGAQEGFKIGSNKFCFLVPFLVASESAERQNILSLGGEGSGKTSSPERSAKGVDKRSQRWAKGIAEVQKVSSMASTATVRRRFGLQQMEST